MERPGKTGLFGRRGEGTSGFKRPKEAKDRSAGAASRQTLPATAEVVGACRTEGPRRYPPTMRQRRGALW
jgi:hypothetical protein